MYRYTSANIVDQSSKLYEVLFDGTEGSSNGKAYWLASSGVVVGGSDYCVFGPGAVDEGFAGPGGCIVQLEWQFHCVMACCAPRSLSTIWSHG